MVCQEDIFFRSFSGFWGLLCVGFFYKKCLVVEIYQNPCFCNEFLTGELVQVVGEHVLIMATQYYAYHCDGLCQKSFHALIHLCNSLVNFIALMYM